MGYWQRIASLRARSVHGLEWVNQSHAAAVKISAVARNDDQAMYARGRGKPRIIDMLSLSPSASPQAAATPGRSAEPPPESIEDRRDNVVQRRRCLGLRLSQLCDAFGDLAHCQRTDRKIGVVDALQPGGQFLCGEVLPSSRRTLVSRRYFIRPRCYQASSSASSPAPCNARLTLVRG